MTIQELTNYDLLEYFKDAVRDDNYNPSDRPYNKSGFKYHELQDEILRRMPSEDKPDEDDGY